MIDRLTPRRPLLIRVEDDRMHLLLMLALTFGTGLVDAVGYLGLDRVLTGTMTGVVILGMALIGGNGLPVVGPLVALGGFVLGAALGGRALLPGRPTVRHADRIQLLDGGRVVEPGETPAGRARRDPCVRSVLRVTDLTTRG